VKVCGCENPTDPASVEGMTGCYHRIAFSHASTDAGSVGSESQDHCVKSPGSAGGGENPSFCYWKECGL